MAGNFADRLMAAIERKKSRVCVCIDPVFRRLPAHLQPTGRYSQEDILRTVGGFCEAIIASVAETAVAVKFNSAFFEALWPGGAELLYRLMARSTRLGLLTLVDVKRSDVGSTAQAYDSAVFSQYAEGAMRPPDAVTVSPWLGSDGVMPFIMQAEELGAGVFVLVKTSNPSAGEIQDLEANGKPVYRHVAELVKRWGEGEGLVGDCRYSSLGAVVGATYPEQLRELRELMPRTPFLVPGFGAQGAGPEDIVGAFDDNGLGAVVNSSRGIIYAYANPRYSAEFSADKYADAAVRAAQDMRHAINEALGLPSE